VIVADTNVFSEPLRFEPDEGVLSWLARHQAEIAITSVTVAELFYGVHRLPEGRRRTGLLHGVEAIVHRAATSGRVLDFDESAAREYAVLRAEWDAAGRPGGVEDTMIAAIARVAGAVVATRNVRDFADTGVAVIDPWTDA
jgi:predicted nucleic acid-binding protein